MKKRFFSMLLVLPLFLGLSVNAGEPAKEFNFHPDRAYIELSYLINWIIPSGRVLPGKVFIIPGNRPPGDKPVKAKELAGKKATPEDWVLEEGFHAIWVTGMPAPEEGERVLLIANIEPMGDSFVLRAFCRLIEVSSLRRGIPRISVHPDDYIYYHLPGTKSNTCPVELNGEAIQIVLNDERDSLVLRAIRPGLAKLNIYFLFFTDREKRHADYLEVMVK